MIINNGVMILEKENENPLTFPNVHLYTSNSFSAYDSFTREIGKVCNLKILQDGGELNKTKDWALVQNTPVHSVEVKFVMWPNLN